MSSTRSLSLFCHLILNIQILLHCSWGSTLFVISIVDNAYLIFHFSWLLHRASSCICWNALFNAFNLVFQMILGRFHMRGVRCVSIWCMSYKWGTNPIAQHVLTVQLHLKWLPLLHNLVDPFAQVFWFEMSASFRALVLLTSVFVSVYTFIIIEV